MRQHRDENEQHRRFDAFGVMAAACDNLGLTDDPRDLYALVDAVVADVQVANPPFACRTGCNACCYSPPMVTSLEWQALHRHLLTLPPEIPLQIVAMADAQRPLAATLRARRQAAVRPDAPPVAANPIQCPMLIDGKCSVYKARPLICRGYGFFFHGTPSPKFFGSLQAFAHIQAHMSPDLVLPLFDPYAQRVGALHAGKGTQGFLAEWLWAHSRDGQLLTEVQSTPDFDGPAAAAGPAVAR